jgi:hypothetical protein
MILQPRKIFIRASRVHNEQVLLLPDTINDQVINDSAALVQQKRVLPDADIELVDVVCEHGIEPFARFRSIGDQLAHMRNVENTDIVSHRLMFLHDAGVLHRHQPPCEWNHLRAEPNVLVVKRRFFWCDFSHAPS